MKSKEYFNKIKEQGKIQSEDFAKFIELLPEFEIPDPIHKEIEGKFMTLERAISDPEVNKKVRAEIFDSVDRNLTNVLPDLDVFDANEINNERDTYKKLKLLGPAMAKAIEKVKKANPSKDEEVKQLTANNAELVEKIKSINTEREKEKEDLKSSYETEKGQILLDYSLKDKINKFGFADEHLPLKDAITNLILTDIKSKHTLSVQDGNIQVQEIVNGVAKPKFNGNDPVTVEKLLEERVQPYLKRNNVDDKKEAANPGRKPTTPAAPSGNETLFQRRAAAATS